MSESDVTRTGEIVVDYYVGQGDHLKSKTLIRLQKLFLDGML